MGEIKSALELALERTNNVQSDKKLIEKNNTIDAGRKAAFEYMEKSGTSAASLEKIIKESSKEKQQWLREGIFKVLINNLKLPENESSLKKIDKIRDGFSAIVENKKESIFLFSQIDQAFKQYLQNKKSVIENLNNNFEQKLKEKEEILSKQLGAKVTLKPENDPEYKEYLHKITNQLDQQYSELIVQIKSELEKRIQG
jgi:predicted acylesterase/phospholipase RssA